MSDNLILKSNVSKSISELSSYYFKADSTYLRVHNSEDGHRIQIEEFRSYSWNKSFHIKLFMDQDLVRQQAEHLGEDPDAMFNLMAYKEAIHMMFGHFNRKYDSYDRKILKLASDLIVNPLLGLGAPLFAIPSLFGLPEGLKLEDYYEILMSILNAQTIEVESEEKNKESNSQDKNEGNEEKENSDKNSEEENPNESEESENKNENKEIFEPELEMGNKTHKESKPSNSNENKVENEGTGEQRHDLKKLKTMPIFNKGEKISDLYEDLSEANIVEIQTPIEYANGENKRTTNSIGEKVRDALLEARFSYGILNLERNRDISGSFKEIAKEIMKSESNLTTLSYGFEDSWHALNNRRKANQNLLYPGRTKTNSGYNTKFDKAPTVFIDVSGSTSSMIKELENLAYYLNQKGAIVVSYNDKIVNIFQPKTEDLSFNSGGMTDIEGVVKEFLASGGELSNGRLYVISDGHDEYEPILRDYKTKVWVISNWGQGPVHISKKMKTKNLI